MKKLNKFDFMVINKRINNNMNGGESQFTGKLKATTKGEDSEMLRKLQRTKKCKSRLSIHYSKKGE